MVVRWGWDGGRKCEKTGHRACVIWFLPLWYGPSCTALKMASDRSFPGSVKQSWIPSELLFAIRCDSDVIVLDKPVFCRKIFLFHIIVLFHGGIIHTQLHVWKLTTSSSVSRTCNRCAKLIQRMDVNTKSLEHQLMTADQESSSLSFAHDYSW